MDKLIATRLLRMLMVMVRVVHPQDALEILLQLQEPVLDVVKATIGLRALESYQDAQGCQQLPVMLLHDTFINQLFKKDPGIGYCVHINVRLIATEKYFCQLHLKGADLAESNLFADLWMRLLELAVQLVLLALRVNER